MNLIDLYDVTLGYRSYARLDYGECSTVLAAEIYGPLEGRGSIYRYFVRLFRDRDDNTLLTRVVFADILDRERTGGHG